jgi:hypothetical protein
VGDRPRRLHDVSRRLALLLEAGMSEGASDEAEKIPVLLSHPLVFEEDEALGNRTTAILYPFRFVPERGFRRPGMAYVPPSPGGGAEGFRGETLWVRARFVFTVAGGSLEGQLGAVEAALRTVHDNPLLEMGSAEGAAAGETGGYPLRIVDDPESWRDLGLAEHRLLIGFEVTLPIESSRFEPFERVTGRDLQVELAEPAQPPRRSS